MIIQSKRVWIASQFIAAQIEIIKDKIVAIYNYNEKPVDKDYQNLRIVPGFIDIHCHGAYGFDTNYAKEDGLKMWMKKLPSEGVTGFLPTTITESHEVLVKAVENIKYVYDQNPEGSEILGIHFEGPFLNMKFKGAQPPEYIVKGSIEEFKQYQKAAGGLIKIITLAVEEDDNFELTHYCAEHNVVVSMGHSNATYQEALMGVANGAKSFTHTYNGMSRFSHREPNLVGAAFRFKDVFSEVICDGNHSNVNSLNILFAAKEADRVIMMTDSLMAKGHPAGCKFNFGGHEIEIYEDGSAHLTDAGKSLAGSTLKMNQGLKILVEEADVPFRKALNSCTLNPATLLNINDHKGAIQVSYDADLVVLKDNYDVKSTFCKGKVYEF